MHNSVTPTWLRQVATALSTRFNVQVREGKGWSIDIDRKVMYYKPEHLLALDRDTCLGILLHELGHLHYTTNDWTESPDSIYRDKQLREICFNGVNAFEDVRINEKMSQAYGGSRELIDAMNELLGGDGVKQFVTMSNDIAHGKRKRTEYSVPDWHEVFYVAMAKLLGQFPDFPPEHYYDPDKLELINEIVDEYNAIDLTASDSTTDVYDFVKNEVFPRIDKYLPRSGSNPVNPDPQGDEMTEMPNSEAESQAEKGEGGQTSNTNGDTDQSSEGSGDTEAENEDTSEASDSETNNGENESEAQPEPEQSGNSQVSEASTSKASEEPYEFDEDEWKKELEEKIKKAIERGRVNPDEQNRTKPFSGNSEGGSGERVHKDCNVDRYDSESEALQSRFRNKFETIFRDNSYARSIPNQKSGRLNKRVLFKHRLQNPRLFTKKTEINKKSYAVAFAMDLSGSMGQRQIEGSFKAMIAFYKTLDRLGIPYGIGFFDHRCIVGKHFSQRKVVNKHLGLQASRVINGGTDPSELLKGLFGKELAQQRAEKKIGVILTDGSWRAPAYQELRNLKRTNPDMQLYIVALGGDYLVDFIKSEIDDKTATIVNSETPEGLVDRYIEIAKKTLL